VALSVRAGARRLGNGCISSPSHEGVSLQEIIVRGLSQVFTSKGLPGHRRMTYLAS